MATAINGEIAKTEGHANTLEAIVRSDGMLQQIAMALPKHITPDRMARVVCTALKRVRNLSICTRDSFLGCLMDCSQMGLEPDGRKAYLIPFKNRRKKPNGQWEDVYECTLIVGYQGYVELVRRSNEVSVIHADVICDNDIFRYDRGEIMEHRIDFKNPRGEVYAAYAMVKYKDGTHQCQVMTKDAIYAIRDKSQGWRAFKKGDAKQSPWDPNDPSSEGEMMKKTVFRRLVKWLPQSSERLTAAIDIDDRDYNEVLGRVITDPAPAGVAALEQRIAAIQHSEPEADDADELFVQLAERLEACGSVEEVHEVEQAFVPDCPSAQLATLAEMCQSRAEQVKGAK